MAVVAVITYMLATAGEGGPGTLLDPGDVDGTLRRMIAFLAPGLVAPPPRRGRSKRRSVRTSGR
jgi:hypothetical protein